MKKIITFTIFLVFIFLIPNISHATSGACSSHGGVNCSAGIGNLGANAVCNDGYESSTSYYDTNECIGNLSLCSQPIKGYCTTASDIRAHCGVSSQYTYEMYDICATDCQNQINKYQNDLSNYNSCASNQEARTTPTTPVTIPSCPINSTYLNGQCTCNDGYLKGGNSCVTYNQSCQSQFGVKSYGDKNKCYCSTGYQWNATKSACVNIACPGNFTLSGNQCICNNGDVMSGNECITQTQDCQNQFGVKSYGGSGLCYCNNGYHLGNSKQCVINLLLNKNSAPMPISAKKSKLLNGFTIGQSATPQAKGIDFSKLTSDPNVKKTTSSVIPAKVTAPATAPRKSVMGKIWDFIKGLFTK